MNYKMDAPLRYSKLPSKIQLRNPAAGVAFPYFNDLFRCQFRTSLPLSPWGYLSAFRVSIVSIISMSPRPEMRPTNAGRVVASVQHQKSFWNQSKPNDPTHPRRKHHCSSVSPGGQLSIPAFLPIASPEPAAIRNLNLGPKAFEQSVRKSLRGEEVSSIVWPLDTLHRSNRVTLPVVSATRGQLLVKGYSGYFSV